MAIERKITSRDGRPGMFFIMKGASYTTNRWLVVSTVPSDKGTVVTYMGFNGPDGPLKWSSSTLTDDDHADVDLTRDWYIFEP